MTSGRVIFVSSNSAMLVVQHDDGFALVELIGDEGEVSTGDVVSGDWSAVAGEPLLLSDGRKLDAYFQGNWPSPDAPMAMARKH